MNATRGGMSRSFQKRLLICAWLLTSLGIAVWGARLARTGLKMSLRAEDGRLVATRGHANLSASRVDPFLARQWKPLRVDWTGYWNVPGPGFVRVVLKTDGAASAALDGVDLPATGEMRLAPGAHHLRVTYWPGPAERREVFLKGVTASGRSIPVPLRQLFPEMPSQTDRLVDGAARAMVPVTLLVWAAFFAVRMRRGDSFKGWLARAPTVLLCLVVLLAASLRFEALIIRYAGVSAPDWAHALAGEIAASRPGGFEHRPTPHPYEGDPFSYLTTARSMKAFYEPSAREPLFPALTRFALFLSGDRDLGISVLSAVCSTLVCVAIFALGSRLLSAWTGLIAAFLWAIEWQVISISVEGWRDDLFSLEVTACAAALVSLYLGPSRRNAIILGALGGLTLLTRLSAFSFLIPGLLIVSLLPGGAPRSERLRAAGAALMWMLLLVGPFMASCALAFGDPFYSVNVHASFYRGRAGLGGTGGSTALEFLAASALPWEFLQTGFAGLTTYPFMNKWFGLGAFLPGLDAVCRGLALVGLSVVLWRPGGVIALSVLFCSILPYAWTWRILGGSEWRFTLPAYPFYLICAAIAAETAIRWMVALKDRGPRGQALGSMLRIAATAALLGVCALGALRWLSWLRVGEAVSNHRPALIETGLLDRVFFVSGWKEVGDEGAGRHFSIGGGEARLRLPVPRDAGVRLVLRTGASEGPIGSVGVWVGDERVAMISGPREPGSTDVVNIPPRREQNGEIELRFVREPASAGSQSPLVLLWVRVEPWVTDSP